MSGASASTPPAQPSDDVSIIVGGQTISGWQDVSISRGVERCPASFSIALTEKYPLQPGLVDIKPGQPIKVMVGLDLALTGYVDRYTSTTAPEQHQVHITGRSMSEDLVDCSAKFQTFQINNTTLIGLARQLCAPFGIQVLSPDGDSSVIPQFSVVLTETPFEIIERVARWANFLVYDDPSGALVIAKLADVYMASGFASGPGVPNSNVQAASVTFSTDQRYTEIDPVWQSTAYLQDAPGANGPVYVPYVSGAQAMDKSFPARADGSPRYRPLIVVSEQTQATPDLAKQRAAWEMARRFGRSQAFVATVDTWRDAVGALWQPNALATINAPPQKLVNVNWLVADVTYTRNENGTTAEVTLMPKEAFIPQIEVLLPFDWQTAQALPGGGSANFAPAPR